MDFPIENGGSFHSFLYVYQRVFLTSHSLDVRLAVLESKDVMQWSGFRDKFFICPFVQFWEWQFECGWRLKVLRYLV